MALLNNKDDCFIPDTNIENSILIFTKLLLLTNLDSITPYVRHLKLDGNFKKFQPSKFPNLNSIYLSHWFFLQLREGILPYSIDFLHTFTKLNTLGLYRNAKNTAPEIFYKLDKKSIMDMIPNTVKTLDLDLAGLNPGLDFYEFADINPQEVILRSKFPDSIGVNEVIFWLKSAPRVIIKKDFGNRFRVLDSFTIDHQIKNLLYIKSHTKLPIDIRNAPNLVYVDLSSNDSIGAFIPQGFIFGNQTKYVRLRKIFFVLLTFLAPEKVEVLRLPEYNNRNGKERLNFKDFIGLQTLEISMECFLEKETVKNLPENLKELVVTGEYKLKSGLNTVLNNLPERLKILKITRKMSKEIFDTCSSLKLPDSLEIYEGPLPKTFPKNLKTLYGITESQKLLWEKKFKTNLSQIQLFEGEYEIPENFCLLEKQDF